MILERIVTSEAIWLLTVFILNSNHGEAAAESSLQVPKCCPQGEEGRPCANSSDPRYPFKPWKDLETYYSPINCTSMMMYDSMDSYYIDDSGSLVHEFDGTFVRKHNPDSYCFEIFHNETVAFFCVSDDEFEEEESVPLLYTVCMIISSVCLVAIALIYAAFKTLRENAHSPYLISHTIALAFAYSCLVQIQLNKGEDRTWCIISGFGVQYFFLAAFFWLNAMSFNIFLTLNEMRPSNRRNPATDKRFLYFSLYAWGCPLLVTVVTLIVKHIDDVPFHFRPNIDKCVLSGKLPTWIYLNGQIALLIAINVLIFILTAVKLLKHRNSSSAVARSRHTFRDQMRYYFLYLKLFIVMGLSWSTEIISSIFAKSGSFWYITDTFNALQGFLIFLIFVFKGNVITLLINEFKTLTEIFSSKNPSNRSSKTLTPMTSVVYTDNH